MVCPDCSVGCVVTVYVGGFGQSIVVMVVGLFDCNCVCCFRYACC